ncbi:hypothetical protein AMTRI_Chr07g23850 [Amborella trichopoda]
MSYLAPPSLSFARCYSASSQPSIILALILRNLTSLLLVPPSLVPLPPLAILCTFPCLLPPFASPPLSGLLL